MSTITVADVVSHLGAQLHPALRAVGQCIVTDICDDSRAVRRGAVYVAIPGRAWHAMDFEEQAAASGAVVAVSDRPGGLLPTIVVKDPRAVVGRLASWFHGNPSSNLRVLGVTGTNGKTSTCHFLHAGLATHETTGLISGSRIAGPGIEEVPQRTTPEAASLQRILARFAGRGVSACAMEVTSHAVEEGRVAGMAYRVMAFTNLSRDHLDYHTSMERYFAAKASLFNEESTEVAVINIDDPYGRRLAASTPVSTWTCSLTDPKADVHVRDIDVGAEGTRFTAYTPYGPVPVALQALGPHQVVNAMVALTVLAADGCDLEAAAAGMSQLSAIPGRCEKVDAGQNFTAVIDYMHNTAAQHMLLPFLRAMTPGRLIVVMGATGGRDRGKRQPLGRTAATYADVVIVTDESPYEEDPQTIRCDVMAGARQIPGTHVIEVADRRAAFDMAVALAETGDTVVAVGRGTDPLQRFAERSLPFNDHTELQQAVTKAMTSKESPVASIN